jgi:hypothetical protein
MEVPLGSAALAFFWLSTVAVRSVCRLNGAALCLAKHLGCNFSNVHVRPRHREFEETFLQGIAGQLRFRRTPLCLVKLVLRHQLIDGLADAIRAASASNCSVRSVANKGFN